MKANNIVVAGSLAAVVNGKVGRKADYDRDPNKTVEAINQDIDSVAMLLEVNGIAFTPKADDASGKKFLLLSDSVAIEELYLDNGQYGSENKVCIMVGGHIRPAAHYKPNKPTAILGWIRTHAHIIHPESK